MVTNISQVGETFALLKLVGGAFDLNAYPKEALSLSLSLSHHNGCIALIRIRADTIRSLRSCSPLALLPFHLIRYFAPAINPRRR